jgi:hypothetical protein
MLQQVLPSHFVHGRFTQFVAISLRRSRWLLRPDPQRGRTQRRRLVVSRQPLCQQMGADRVSEWSFGVGCKSLICGERTGARTWDPMIKSQPYAVLIQRAFRHVHVSSSTEITMEFSFVGIKGRSSKSHRIEPRSWGFQSGDRYRFSQHDANLRYFLRSS